MAFTVTMRQQGYTRAQVKSIVTHEYRKTLGRSDFSHDNPDIDPARTGHNLDWIFRDGVPTPLESVSEIHDELEARLSRAGGTRTLKDGTRKKIAIRKDAGVVRSFIVQLDPELGDSESWIDHPDSTAEEMRWMMDVIIQDHIGGLYGKHNLLSATLHLDEGNPHIHLMVTPIDSEGRVRQKSFISGREEMRDFWAQGRKKLKAAGYDVALSPEKGQPKTHLPLPELKAKTRLEEGNLFRLQAEADRAGAVSARLAEFKAQLEAQHTAQLAQLQAEERRIREEREERERELEAREQALEGREQKVTAREKAVKARETKALLEEIRLEGRTEGLEGAKQKLIRASEAMGQAQRAYAAREPAFRDLPSIQVRQSKPKQDYEPEL